MDEDVLEIFSYLKKALGYSKLPFNFWCSAHIKFFALIYENKAAMSSNYITIQGVDHYLHKKLASVSL